MKKPDFSLDFDAMLASAQDEWKRYRDALLEISKKEEYSHCMYNGTVVDSNGCKFAEARIKLTDDYMKWIKDNIEAHGVQMVCRDVDGKPKSLFLIVAGEESHIFSAS